MRKILFFLFVSSLLLLNSNDTIFSQELPGVFINKTQWRGNNTAINNDMSSMPKTRIITQQETDIMKEIQMLRRTDDRNNLSRILQLEAQLEALNPQSVSRSRINFGGITSNSNKMNPPFIPNAIGNILIRNTGSTNVRALATATQQRGTYAGRIWVAAALSTDSIMVYYSDDNGLSWIIHYTAWGANILVNSEDMDMEIIENNGTDAYVWIVFGFRENNGAGRWRTGAIVTSYNPFLANIFYLIWPGDDSSKRYYNARITSDNATYPTVSYVYIVTSFDSLLSVGHRNTQKTARCTNPYTVNPNVSYKADKFAWYGNSLDGNLKNLHSDIAYFRNGGSDSIIVSYSNVPDSTKIYFAKSDINNGPAFTNGAGGPIGGDNPNDFKQYARLSSNGNDNGSIYCVFRQYTNPRWRISYFRTTNWGNFNSMYQAGLQGSLTAHSYQPDIVGVRNYPKHYFTWVLGGSTDSLRYIGTTASGTWPQNIGKMNGQPILSGVQGPKPGFRFTNNDSCFVIYSQTGPSNVWAALGCSGSITGVENNQSPARYNLSQNYPNPFNPTTSIRFDIPKDGLVKLVVYNILGKEVATVINEVKKTGSYIVDFNASSLSSGVYFYKLTAGDFSDIMKMILFK
ncbi:MAG: T9SS type A sorting domain-containing protein [Ignavibacteria bacterium]|nr:T9SS type A sorting domain-containing protein [Ignavibacteria bacterium]